ncbi:sugar transferase [Microbacterium sp. zg-YB36]|uniref:sugar transferase n=1 Tax=Microbacterium sp. zg-YB36 TaxID=2969407 RepID=UPI00214CA1D2|nr:sugar transferase [Microbacterium sp. zg-YB36]MDL5352382.1 sugar transferase [Microbacterium sp. zg-YB36]
MSSATLPLDGETSVGAPRVPPLLEQRLGRLRRRRMWTGSVDAAVIVAASAATAATQWATTSGIGAGSARLQLLAGCFVLATVWIAALFALRATAHRHGAGRRLELLPVVHAAAIGFAALAITAGVARWPLLPEHVLVTLPVGIGALVTARLLREVWRTHGRQGIALAPRALIVGDRAGIEHTIRSLRLDGRLGHNVVGTALADEGVTELTVDHTMYPVLGAPGQAARIARDLCADTVIVAAGTDNPDFVRRLSWSLEGAATDLILATRLTDVSRSRIAFERTNGLALTHISLPRFDHSSVRAKRALDVVVALVALVPIAVITPLIALLIRMDTPGGVFFHQRRIGRDGREFDILKFRTMSVTAEAERAQLEALNQGAGPLFKMKDDPRVTRVGGFLRRFSLDELPQFWNVLKGEMSVVGPRPPLPTEVRGYDGTVFRRLYVQPGITGLWQVSGRSDLTWEQSVRLDLHYVENWSLATDLGIILRTAAVMVRPKGAY